MISDLHCHKIGRNQDDSFLLAGGPRLPALTHPVQAMLEGFAQEELTADVLLCPGDLSDRMCSIGFQHAIFVLQEIANHFQIPQVVASLGNHDVSSRRAQGEPDAFYAARTSSTRFPVINKERRESYLAYGSCVLNLPPLQLVLINSVIDHHDEASAKRGSFGPERIGHLRQQLMSAPDARFKIGVLHHHVIPHSSPYLGDEDLLPTGNDLIELLAEHEVRTLLHGHKHHPRATYVDSAHGRVFVFAAGSFSALIKGGLATITRNVFHLIDLKPQDFGSGLKGIIRTWEWRVGKGWVPASSESADFPHAAGFGATDSAETLAARAYELVDSTGKQILTSAEVIDALPDLQYLTPSELERLGDLLLNRDIRLTWRGGNPELARLIPIEQEQTNA